MSVLGILLVGGLVAAGLSGLLAWRGGLLDQPNARSLHQQPVPRGGGLAVLAGLYVGIYLLGQALDLSALWWLGGLTGIAAVSLLDDAYGLSPWTRLLAQLAAAVALLIAIGAPSWGLFYLLLALLGSIWAMNLYNFMDGSDGLAGGMGGIGFGALALLSWEAGATDYAVLAALISASCLGFLFWNWHPARLFLGDVGAVPLGYLLASLALAGPLPLWVTLLIFSPFVVDATATLLQRLRRGEAIWRPHRQHYYQRLLQAGLGHRDTALLAYGLMLLAALSAGLLWVSGQVWLQILGLAAWGLLYAVLGRGIDRLERRGGIRPGYWNRLVLRLRNRWAVFLHDLCWAPLAAWMAFGLRFNLDGIPLEHQYALQAWIGLALPIHAWLSWYFGLYRGIWRYASMPDLIRILNVVLVGTVLVVAGLFVWQRLEGVPRSVVMLYPLLLLLGLGMPRIIYRWLKDHHLALAAPTAQRVLIVGAGAAAELLLRDLLRHPGYQPVALVDDDPAKRGKAIHGVRVLGQIADLSGLFQQTQTQLVLIALPSAHSALLEQVALLCAQWQIPCRTLPSLAELADGRVTLARLRPVEVEDLLGRAPVALDSLAIAAYLRGKRVLVTGGGGSIGSELCRQIARQAPECLYVLDYSEFNLFRIEQELRRMPELRWHTTLADVRQAARVEQLLTQWRPEVIFHAAALKHVPLVEANPEEGLCTNVIGTRQVAEAALRHGCSRFVLISTDKAVNPGNVMGASKRLAEQVCQALSGQQTRFITTRFGNVLDSSGSVVPLFKEQIARGGPVTVTHPEVTRYFMTIPEAVGLILQAGALGQGGEIFVLDMGLPVKIAHLAEQMIRLSGKQPGVDIAITYTGLRPGEKLEEELFHPQERYQTTAHPKLLLASARVVEAPVLLRALDELAQACQRYDSACWLPLLRQLVPEFQPQAGVTPLQTDGLK